MLHEAVRLLFERHPDDFIFLYDFDYNLKEGSLTGNLAKIKPNKIWVDVVTVCVELRLSHIPNRVLFTRAAIRAAILK